MKEEKRLAKLAEKRQRWIERSKGLICPLLTIAGGGPDQLRHCVADACAFWASPSELMQWAYPDMKARCALGVSGFTQYQSGRTGDPGADMVV